MRYGRVITAIAAGALIASGSAASAATTNGRIAYANSQVFTISPSGAGLAQFTHESGGAADPDWSPDGRYLAFDVGGAYLNVTNADGTGEHTLPLNDNATDPSWSSDDSQLVFTGVQYDQNGVPEDTDLFVTRADGSNYVHIGPGSQPDWSPTSNWIVYRSNPARTDGCPGVWRIRSDGTENEPVAPAHSDGGVCSGGGSSPSFSPNGKRVVFVSSDGTAIQTVSLYGGNKHRVVRDALPKTSPVFSPDGKKIAYATGGPNPGIWVVKAKGGKPKRIATASGAVTWQPLSR